MHKCTGQGIHAMVRSLSSHFAPLLGAKSSRSQSTTVCRQEIIKKGQVIVCSLVNINKYRKMLTMRLEKSKVKRFYEKYYQYTCTDTKSSIDTSFRMFGISVNTIE